MAVERLPAELIRHGFEHLRIAVADVENAESAETVDILAPGDVAIGVRSGVGPLDDGLGAGDVRRLAVFEKAGIDVFAKSLDGLACNPDRVLRRNLRFRDEFQDFLRVG